MAPLQYFHSLRCVGNYQISRLCLRLFVIKRTYSLYRGLSRLRAVRLRSIDRSHLWRCPKGLSQRSGLCCRFRRRERQIRLMTNSHKSQSEKLATGGETTRRSGRRCACTDTHEDELITT